MSFETMIFNKNRKYTQLSGILVTYCRHCLFFSMSSVTQLMVDFRTEKKGFIDPAMGAWYALTLGRISG